MEQNKLVEALVELIRRSSVTLPFDVRKALERAVEQEDKRSVARSTLLKILENVKLAEKQSTPVCQDTGTLIFHVGYGPGYRQSALRAAIEEAVRQATAKGCLRPNAVDSLSGKNSGDNVGIGSPFIDFLERDAVGLEVGLLQKGGGSENVSCQYSLPYAPLKAGRDLGGVRRVVLDAVYQAQGLGCSPGIIGVGIGGDRATSYLEAKLQLLRPLDDANPDQTLGLLEDRLVEEANSLGIGPMGFGGKTTVLGVKIGARHRLPASFFVSIAYMCWAARRAHLTIDGKGEVSYA